MNPKKILSGIGLALIAICSHADTATGNALLQRGDYIGAQSQFRTAAEAGDAEALFQLGRMMENGWGMARDENEATAWYRKAADQGNPAAQNALGMKLYAAQPQGKERNEVVDLFRKSAEQGFAPGQYNYGLMHQLGWGVEKNELLALEWFRKAAAQNEPAAFYWLGNAHENGVGTPKDDQAAVHWYRKGADLKDPMSQNSLGAMYSAGRGGLPLSVSEMLKWIRLSAEQGYGSALYNLGLIHEKGFGVPADYAVAHSWFNLAAARGVVEAAEARAKIEKSMSPDQVAQAQRLSREWQQQATSAPSQLSRQNGTAKSGTGFYVSAAGELLTNHHVTEGCREIFIQPGRLPARLVAKDSRNDLALLATAATKSYARFRSGKSIRRGEEVVVIGYPLRGTVASGASVTTGVISALGGIGDDTSKLQISAPVQPGNSGGPVIDGNGNVVGIVYGKINALDLALKTGDIPQNVNFAINLPTITGFLDAHNIDYVITQAGEKTVRNKNSASNIGQRYTRIVECVE